MQLSNHQRVPVNGKAKVEGLITFLTSLYLPTPCRPCQGHNFNCCPKCFITFRQIFLICVKKEFQSIGHHVGGLDTQVRTLFNTVALSWWIHYSPICRRHSDQPHSKTPETLRQSASGPRLSWLTSTPWPRCSRSCSCQRSWRLPSRPSRNEK